MDVKPPTATWAPNGPLPEAFSLGVWLCEPFPIYAPFSAGLIVTKSVAGKRGCWECVRAMALSCPEDTASPVLPDLWLMSARRS